ncbi:MAG: hypothetical protein D6690_02740 [Nitrospirae bacterium]|nr:MAG: hypothetical protein D6690_02740 [Nitrospirota bacterium]
MLCNPMSPRKSKIVTAVERIRKALEMHPPLPVSEFKQNASQIKILRQLIFTELEEIVIILLMLEESRQRAAFYNEQTLNASTDIEPKFNLLITSFHNEIKKLTLHIKCLYEWLYHLQNLIRSDKTIEQLISQEQWPRLDADCEFRGAFIAHKKQFQHYVIEPL